MHVVHVSYFVDPWNRSPEQLLAAWPTLIDVPRAVRKAGVQVTVVQAAGTDAVLERDGIPFHFVAFPRLWRLRRAFGVGADRVADQVNHLEPTLVHFHGLCFPHQLGSMQARLGGVPIIVQDHGNSPPRFGNRWVLRRALAGTTAALFTAEEQARAFVERRSFPAHLNVLEVIESSSTFTPGDQVDARDRTGLSGDPCVVWIGRLNRTKDPLTVLEGVRRAIAALPSLILWCFYSDASLLAEVRSFVAAHESLAKRVHLMGSVPHEEVELLFRAADFLVLGSHREGSGYSVLEALACGATPIITAIPSFRKLTGGGSVGALWPPGDAAAMARELIDLAARDRLTLRRAARTHFESFLSFDVLGSQLRKIYEAVTG